MGSAKVVHQAVSAFVYVPSDIVDNITHQLKLKQFINLINTCEIKITQGADFPDDFSWSQYDFFFIDWFGRGVNHQIPTKILQLARNHKVVLFNISHDNLDEKYCLMSGIDGIFYSEDRPDIVLKGIESIKDNGLWYKRDTMGRALATFLNTLRQKNNVSTCQSESAQNTAMNATLTKREQMIIKLVSKGAKNKEIADQLHISPNTVKTHIYSIFRKTSSRNRIELMAWSQQFVN